MLRRCVPAVVLVLAAARVPGAVQGGPVNLGFEDGRAGQMPAGWQFVPPVQAAATVNLSAERPRSGSLALMLAREAPAPPGVPVVVLQSFDATAFRGLRVRFRAAVRTDGSAAQAQLWVRVDRPRANGQAPYAFFDNMDDRPIRSAEWVYGHIVGDVAPDAASIVIGAMLFGTGRAFVDDGAFEVVGKADVSVDEPPRPLTARGLENLVALTKLLGYVRHFHPGDEAATADWNAVAIAAVRDVERGPDAAALVQSLAKIFNPLAPAVEIFPAGSRPSGPSSSGGARPAASRLLTYRHFGFGAGTSNGIYRSERVETAAVAAPFEADLGGGVRCRVPLVAAGAGAARPADAADAFAPYPRPTRPTYSLNDRATRLAAVALGWNVLEHFYPYFDVVATDWPGALREALSRAAADRDERAFTGTLRRLVAALRDGHGRVGSPVEAFAVPAVGWDWIEDGLVITNAGAGGPTLAPGDKVVAIDGRPVPQLIAEREALISGATPQWIRWRAVSEIAAGPGDAPVVLDVERFSTRRTARVTLTRTATSLSGASRPDKLAELEPGILYIDLSRISDADLTASISRLVAARGLVFDLRGYPSSTLNAIRFFGLLTEVRLTSAQWHVPQPARPHREGVTFFQASPWQIAPQSPYLKARKAFLTDGRAISYAESCMGIVEHYKLGEIVGGATAGTNGNVSRIALPGGLSIIFTGMKVLKHDGSQHHGIGIRPTIPVAPTRAGVAAGRDEVLERGIQAVR